jgi:hypothetical protein
MALLYRFDLLTPNASISQITKKIYIYKIISAIVFFPFGLVVVSSKTD